MKNSTILLGIIVIIIIISNIYYYLLESDYEQESIPIHTQHFINNLNTGDIIFLCRKKLRRIDDVLLKSFTCLYLSTVFYHSGIVIEENGIKKLLTVSFYTTKSMKSYPVHRQTVVTEIPDFFRKKEFIVKVYRHPKWNHTKNDIDTVIKDYMVNKMRFYFSLFDFAFKMSGAGNKMVCTTFVGRLLAHLGYLPPIKHEYYHYSPGRIEPILKKNGFDVLGMYDVSDDMVGKSNI